jgi:hypothetical protein
LQSQRRFRERKKEQDEETRSLINTRINELEIARNERRNLDLEHQILLRQLYVKEAIFQRQCQAANITLAPLTEPLPRTQTAVCSIVKDLAILLAIPQSPGPLLPPPAVPSASKEAMIIVGEAGNIRKTSVDAPQCSNADATETLSSTPTAAASAPTATARATDSSGVENESIEELCTLPLPRPVLHSSMEYAPGNLLARSVATNPQCASDVVAAAQSLQNAEHFLHYHSILMEALADPSMPVFSPVDDNGSIAAHNNTRVFRLVSLYNAMSNVHALYWHTAQLKPEVSVDAAYAKLPQNTELAVEIASKMVHEFNSEELVEFRKVSRGYQRDMNKISVSVEGWMERIRMCAVPKEPLSFALAAAVSLDLVKCVSQLNAAVSDGIKARREMLQNLKSRFTLEHIAYINSSSYPYMPDHVAVYTLLQEIARELHTSNAAGKNEKINQ